MPGFSLGITYLLIHKYQTKHEFWYCYSFLGMPQTQHFKMRLFVGEKEYNGYADWFF